MAFPKKISNLLEKKKIKYESLQHRTVYTAFDKSQTLRVPEKIIGKTLVLKTDKDYAFVLIPANRNLDKGKFKKAVNDFRKKVGQGMGQKPIKNIDFITEQWMKKNLKGIKLGAIPPFGVFWKFLTFVDRGLVKNPKIIINSGDYNFSIKISPANFKKLVPDLFVGDFSKKR